MELEFEQQEKELLTKIISFVKSDAGMYLTKMITETKNNRINELIYAQKDEMLVTQGEVRALNDIINLFNENTLKLIREQFENNPSNI